MTQQILLGFESITVVIACAYILKLLVQGDYTQSTPISWGKRSLMGQRIAPRH